MKRNSALLKEILCISLLMHVICSFLVFQLLLNMFSHTKVIPIVSSKAHKELMLCYYYVLRTQNKAYLKNLKSDEQILKSRLKNRMPFKQFTF